MTIHAKQTQSDVENLAAQLASVSRPGAIYTLRGPLGAGKSTFSRAFIRSLCNNPDLEVPSPTFTLVQTYDTPVGPLWHVDLYRLKDPYEAVELGLEDAFQNAICLVEWPEILTMALPARFTDIAIAFDENDSSKRNLAINHVRL